MSRYNNMILTVQGRRMLAKIQTGECDMVITRAVLGDGEWDTEDDLAGAESLKNPVQSFGISEFRREGEQILLRFIACNFEEGTETGLKDDYFIREIGIYAREKSEDDEILYGIVTADVPAFMPAYDEASPVTITFNTYVYVGDGGRVVIQADPTAYVLAEDFRAFQKENDADLEKKLDKTGDASDSTVTFEQAKERENISTGGKMSKLFGIVAKWFADMKTVAFTGSYNDLGDTPDIPEAVRVKGAAETEYHTGDVNLTPEDIGALPSGGKAQNSEKLNGLQAKEFIGNKTGFIRPNHIGGSTNANDYTTEWHGFVYNMSNLPPSESYGFFDVTWFNGDGFTLSPTEKGGVVRQIFTSWNTSRIYTRVRVNNSWGNWQSNNVGTIIDTENRIYNIIQAYGDGAGYGTQLVIGGGGNTFIGAGEAAGSLYTAFQTASNLGTNEAYAKNGENMYIASDGHVYIYSNANTVANRKGICLTSAGDLIPINNSNMFLGEINTPFGNVVTKSIFLPGNGSIIFDDEGTLISKFNNKLLINGTNGIELGPITSDLVVKTLKISKVATGKGIQMTLTDVANEGLILYDTSFCPLNDNVTGLGGSGHRWRQIVSMTSTISTSDRNLKKQIKDLASDDRYIKFFMMLQPKSYLFKDGESGRTHVGFISQDVEDAMEACGLSSLEFAGFCKDVKMEVVEDEETHERKEIPVEDEDGNPVYEYSLRYEEFIAMNTMMIQKVYDENKNIKDRLTKIEEKIGI